MYSDNIWHISFKRRLLFLIFGRTKLFCESHRMCLVTNINITIHCVSSRLYFIPRISKDKVKLLYTQPSALAAAHRDKGTGPWCWLRCWGAAPGGPLLWPFLGSVLSLQARSTPAAPQGDGTGTLHGCHLFLQPVSHQCGSWGAVCHVTPTVMLFPNFSFFFSRLCPRCGQNHILLFLYPALSTVPFMLILIEWSVWNNRVWTRELEWVLVFNQ